MAKDIQIKYRDEEDNWEELFPATKSRIVTTENGQSLEEVLTLKTDISYVDEELSKKVNKKQEEWIAPTLLNGATSKPGFPVGYMKDEMDIVHFRGKIIASSYGVSVMTLPVGYRPSSNIDFLCYVENNKFGRVNVQNGGAVYPRFPYDVNTEYDLSSISFRVVN